MRIHSETKINQIKSLRSQGHSINEISGLLKIPKTTVWHHIQNVEVSTPFKSILRSKRGGSTMRTKKEWTESEMQAKKILSGEQAKLAIAAAMLYWGEGGKKVCDLTNTDPKLLQLYLNFLYKVVDITQEQIKFVMRIFTGMNQEECLSYWSENLNVSKDKFVIRYNDGGISGKSKYGMCRIILRRGRKVFKLMHSLIRLSFSDIMGFATPVPQWIDYRRAVDLKQIASP